MTATALVLVAMLTAKPAHAQQVRAPAQPKSAPATLYTQPQADRGEQVFARVCSFCHGTGEFAGVTFETTWRGQSVAQFLDFIGKNMPYNTPGGLTPQQYADVVAYILHLNAFPAGNDELVPGAANAQLFDRFDPK